MYLQYYFCAILIVMKVLVLSDCHVDSNIFVGLVIISVYVKCFNIDVRIYGTLLILAFFVILILMYVFIVLVPF